MKAIPSKSNGRFKLSPALLLPCAALLASCGYNIIPPPPVSMPQSSAPPIPARAALMNVAIKDDNSADDVEQKSNEVLAALKQTQVFQDIERAGNQLPLNTAAVVRVSYADKTEQGSIGFVFPPCLLPLVDFCILPLGTVNIDIGAEVRLDVDAPNGQLLKSYSETSKGTCSYVPFPGLFPFNLGIIPEDVHCHTDAGPDAAFQLALAKISQDLINDRDGLASLIRQGVQASPSVLDQNQTAPAAAPASGEKPWWQQ